jgi:formylglycine-generating enzyme required for sulfatase activity
MQDLAPDGQPNKPSSIPIPIRYSAAETLDRLGWLPDDLNTWVEVQIRNPKSEIQNRVYVGRYPVTNAQFALFMAAGGYENPKYWSGEDSAAWRWRMTEHNVSWRGEGPVAQPEYWDHPRFGRSRCSYPVVGVSWYEASAYAAWLTELLRRRRAGEELERACQNLIAGLLEHIAVVRLPTDEEWLAAAGGARQERYPWGREWGESHANTEEGDIRGTTPVAMYPSGRSPEGVWDMGGNVWEWVATPYGEEGEYRILRGGSWSYDRSVARSGVRYGNSPDFSIALIGFRLVGSPACSGF